MVRYIVGYLCTIHFIYLFNHSFLQIILVHTIILLINSGFFFILATTDFNGFIFRPLLEGNSGESSFHGHFSWYLSSLNSVLSLKADIALSFPNMSDSLNIPKILKIWLYIHIWICIDEEWLYYVRSICHYKRACFVSLFFRVMYSASNYPS